MLAAVLYSEMIVKLILRIVSNLGTFHKQSVAINAGYSSKSLPKGDFDEQKPGVAEQRIAKSPDQSEIGAFAFYFSGFKCGGFRLYDIMLAAVYFLENYANHQFKYF